jgi:tRNA 2-thiouridine synthesizing protein A
MAQEMQNLLKKVADDRYVLDMRGSIHARIPSFSSRKALKSVEKNSVVEVLTDNPPSLDTLPRSIRNNKQEYLGTEVHSPGVWKNTCAENYLVWDKQAPDECDVSNPLLYVFFPIVREVCGPRPP